MIDSLRLIEMFRSKKGNVGQLLKLLQQTKSQEPTDVRSLVLRVLPILLGDKPTDFFKACFDSDDQSFRHLDFGILIVDQGVVCPSSLHLNPASVKTVIGGELWKELKTCRKLCASSLGLHMHCI